MVICTSTSHMVKRQCLNMGTSYISQHLGRKFFTLLSRKVLTIEQPATPSPSTPVAVYKGSAAKVAGMGAAGLAAVAFML